jgi:hypothetical protein
MKNTIIIWLLPAICFLALSCGREDGLDVFSFKGKAQKGPFITGTTITLNELNANLGQTGKSFTTTITSDDGSFELNNIELNSDLALLTANGFYFSELYGQLSPAALSLQAMTDLSKKETVNVNVFTYIIKARVENLVNSGQSFHDANEQAKSELLTFLNVPGPFNEIDFNELDISQNNEFNAALLAFSIMLQRYTTSVSEKARVTAELTQLLTNISIDLSDNGQINSQHLIDTLIYNISQMDFNPRGIIERGYADLGISATIADFETYINRFQEKHSKVLYESFYYPSVAPGKAIQPDGRLTNLLYPDDSVYQLKSCSLAAIVPLYSTLKVKFKKTSFNDSTRYFYFGGFSGSGWRGSSDTSGITLIAQRQNTLLATYIYFEHPGTARIEYYENNNTEIPTFTKNIKWE